MTKAQKKNLPKQLVMFVIAFVLGVIADIFSEYKQQSKENQGDFMEYAKMTAEGSALDMAGVAMLVITAILLLVKPTSLNS
jgi:p-aminobenzoyl-glutamate transporter AbgT